RLRILLNLLELEQIDKDVFRAASRDIGLPQVFGGQVLAQALRAAYATVSDQHMVHSLHAYFLARGDFNAPIMYFVDHSRDGNKLSSRRITAIQHGAQIFHMAASFHLPEDKTEDRVQIPMPDVPPPEEVPDGVLPAKAIFDQLPDKVRRF